MVSEGSGVKTPVRGPPWILLIYLTGLAFRLYHYFQSSSSPIAGEHFLLIDSEFYDLWAKDIAAGNWIGREAFFMGPLYPYCLAVVYAVLGSDFAWIRLLQTLLGSLTCVGIYLLGKRIFSRTIGLVGALICTFYGPLYYYENLLLATSLMVFLSLACGLLLTEAQSRNRGIWWLIAGLALGVSAVGKANMLLAVPFVLLWIVDLNRSRGMRGGITSAVWFGVGIVLMVVPVTARNALVQKDFVLLTANGGLNLYVGNNPDSEGVWKRFDLPYPGANIDGHLAALRKGETAYGETQPSEINRRLTAEVWSFIREDPGAFLALLGKKSLAAVNAFDVSNRDDYAFGQRFSAFLRLPLLGLGVVAPLGFLGFVLCLRDPRRYFVPLLFTAVPFATMILLFVLSRYRLPAIPFLCLLAAKALGDLVRLARSRTVGRLALLIALLLAFTALVHWPFASLGVASWRGAANAAYGRHLMEQGELDAALRELDTALELNPRDALALNLRAGTFMKMKRYDAALADYRRCHEHHPDDLRWVIPLANLLRAMQRYDELERLYANVVARVEAVGLEEMAATHLYGRLLAGRGSALLARGEATAAETAFRDGIRCAPQESELHCGLALLLAEDPARHEEALHHARRAVQIRATARSVSTLGWVLYKAGDLDQAERVLERARATWPQQSEIAARLQKVREAKTGSPE